MRSSHRRLRSSTKRRSVVRVLRDRAQRGLRQGALLFARSLLVFSLWACDPGSAPPSTKVEDKPESAAALATLAEKPIAYTRHARCRMACRKVSEAEVKETLREGRINWAKTRTNDQPCPSFAVEDRSRDGQLLRVVYAACAKQTRVITAIDLETDHPCNCD